MYVVDGTSRIIYYPSNYTNYLWSGQTLKRGDRNDYVKTLQSWLYKAGFNPGGIDGVYGANTEKAVKEFQKKVGITADGIAGKQTYQALQEYVRTQTTVSRSNSSGSDDRWTGQTLREGDRGQAVKDLQAKLQRLGYNVGAVDGIYGKQTAEAVKSFQKAHGLTADGLAGKSTYHAIEHAMQQKIYYNQKTIVENKYKALENKVHSKDSTWEEVVKSLKEIAKLGFDFIIGDDIKTLLDGNASTIDKLIASLSFIPGGKVVNEGVKLSKMGSKVLLRLDLQFFAREAVHSVIRSLPENPKDLLKRGWQDVTDPRMKANTKMREYKDPVTGLKVRFDPATPGASGYEGKDHYHIYNPNATGKNDMYLDINGNPVAKGSKASHIVINRGKK
ncbi:peptidoglycan-binding protein [Geobacillus sp. FSL K6-0789]|nr:MULTISPECIES: peptidoglycan-binding protein [Geobacillus]MED3777235.1 peptidoglycan-binding protein [Geobacillus stearothermophilus]MED4360330.1 peptidoglycan-binding protein [Geobacillus stearothermophilus]MED4832365.1 peptidoglycan-binding protein [Geobacillus stearothermophilus]MED4880597.1 peptidoglycan-binding protein [Geobacillus stearothermophilus]MED4960103.1 peptidoglycan-binding protein [Geobacillus stearothermophilus]